jgi:hypothetical protein
LFFLTPVIQPQERIGANTIHSVCRARASASDLMVDAFNVANQPNADEIDTTYDAPFVPTGVAVRHRFGDGVTGAATLASNPTFGAARTVLNPRQLQFAAKLSF